MNNNPLALAITLLLIIATYSLALAVVPIMAALMDWIFGK